MQSRYDITGYEDLVCTGKDISLRFAIFKFQSTNPTWKEELCSANLTRLVLGLCSRSRCKNPTLERLNLEPYKICPDLKTGFIGIWEIMYSCITQGKTLLNQKTYPKEQWTLDVNHEKLNVENKLFEEKSSKHVITTDTDEINQGTVDPNMILSNKVQTTSTDEETTFTKSDHTLTELETTSTEVETTFTKSDHTLETTSMESEIEYISTTIDYTTESEIVLNLSKILSTKSENISIGSIFAGENESGITSTQNDITFSESKIKSTESGITSPKSDSTSSESNITSAKSGILSTESEITSIENENTSAKSDITFSEIEIKSTESGILSAEVKSDITSAESGITSAESGITFAESGITFTESSITSAESGITSAESGITSAKSGITFAEHENSPSESEKTKSETTSYKNENTSTKSENALYENETAFTEILTSINESRIPLYRKVSKSSENENASTEDKTDSTKDESTPTISEFTFFLNETLSAENETKSTESEAKSTESETKSTEIEIKSAESETKSTESETKSSETETKSSKHETKSSESETKSTESETKSSESETRSTESETKSSEYETKSTKNETKSFESKTNSSKSETNPSKSETKSFKSDTKSTESQTKLTKNEKKLTESETESTISEIKSTEKGTKPTESETKSTELETKLSENKTKSNKNETKSIENETNSIKNETLLTESVTKSVKSETYSTEMETKSKGKNIVKDYSIKSENETVFTESESLFSVTNPTDVNTILYQEKEKILKTSHEKNENAQIFMQTYVNNDKIRKEMTKNKDLGKRKIRKHAIFSHVTISSGDIHTEHSENPKEILIDNNSTQTSTFSRAKPGTSPTLSSSSAEPSSNLETVIEETTLRNMEKDQIRTWSKLKIETSSSLSNREEESKGRLETTTSISNTEAKLISTLIMAPVKPTPISTIGLGTEPISTLSKVRAEDTTTMINSELVTNPFENIEGRAWTKLENSDDISNSDIIAIMYMGQQQREDDVKDKSKTRPHAQLQNDIRDVSEKPDTSDLIHNYAQTQNILNLNKYRTTNENSVGGINGNINSSKLFESDIDENKGLVVQEDMKDADEEIYDLEDPEEIDNVKDRLKDDDDEGQVEVLNIQRENEDNNKTGKGWEEGSGSADDFISKVPKEVSTNLLRQKQGNLKEKIFQIENFNSETPTESTDLTEGWYESLESRIMKETEEEIKSEISSFQSELDSLILISSGNNVSKAEIKSIAQHSVSKFFRSISSSINVFNFHNEEHISLDATSDTPDSLKTASSILNITDTISRSIAGTLEIGESLNIETADIKLTVMKRKMINPSLDDKNSTSSSMWEAKSLTVNLPDQISLAGLDSTITVAFSSINNLGSMMNLNKNFSTSILSVSVLHVEKVGSSIPLQVPLEFTILHPNMENMKRNCVYWDFTREVWSSEGCFIKENTERVNGTTCQCFHLTNFAVLVDIHDVALNLTIKQGLDIITLVGCSVSIVCLLVCLIVYSMFSSARNERSVINFNICLCLLLAEFLFLFGIGETGNYTLCFAVAVCLHYLFMASFMWMLVAGFQIYQLLVQVWEKESSRRVQYYLFGYISPLLILLSSLLLDTLLHQDTVYGGTEYCWITDPTHLLISFIGKPINQLIF